jgi:putative intracellular protease/amidase
MPRFVPVVEATIGSEYTTFHDVAGPLSLISHDIGKGKNVTSHPSIKDELVKAGGLARWKSTHECSSNLWPGRALKVITGEAP